MADRTTAESLALLASSAPDSLSLMALLAWMLPAEKAEDSQAIITAMVKNLFEAAVEHLGKDGARGLFCSIAKTKQGGRGKAKKEKLSHYDRELKFLYRRVRGLPVKVQWRDELTDRGRFGKVRPVELPKGEVGTNEYRGDWRLADLMGLDKVKRASSLPREIAAYLCEQEWHPEVLEIFGGRRPKAFELGTADTDTVARRIRAAAKEPSGISTVWPARSRRRGK